MWIFSSCCRIPELRWGFQASSCVCPGKPNLPFELLGKAGGCTRVTAGPKRPHLCLCLGLNVPLKGRQGSRGGFPDSPLGVRPRLEGKQRMPLSSQVATQISWSPLGGLKGGRPPLQFGERTRDCPPGQAGKEGSHLARTGPSQGFPRAAAPVGVFSRGTTRISGSLSCGAREARSPCAWRGGARPGSRVTGGD